MSGVLLAPSAELQAEIDEARRSPISLVDRYVVLKRIGSGGSGVVHRAYDTEERRLVALKFLDPRQNEEILAHGLREPRVLQRLDHPAIPRVLGEGTHGGFPFFAMEYAPGVLLEAYRPRSHEEAARILETTARAVAHAHERGIIHRDISPQNIVYDPDHGRTYLLDFGISRVEGAGITVAQLPLGKLRYMSPELFEGQKATAGSDVYALGATLYYAVTHKEPFHDLSEKRLRAVIANIDPRSPRSLRFDVPPGIDIIIRTSMQKDPAARYAGAKEFAHALRRYLAGQDVGPAPRLLPRLYRIARHHAVSVGAIAASALAVAMLAAFLVSQSRLQESEQEPWETYYDGRYDPAAREWEGSLLLESMSGDAFATFKERLTGPVRLEYTARVGADAPGVCDASCFFSSTPHNVGAGLFVGLGSELNTRAKVVRANRVVWVNDRFRLRRDVPHRVVVERDERGVRAWVDDDLVVDYEEPLPTSEDTSILGFYARGSRVQVSNVRIWRRRVPARTPKARLADRLFGAGAYDDAARAYGDLLDDAKDARLEYKRAVALVRRCEQLGATSGPSWEEARSALERLLQGSTAALAELQLLAMELAERRVEEGVGRLARALTGPDASRRFSLMSVVEERFQRALRQHRWDEVFELAEAVMTRLQTQAVDSIGTGNFGDNLPLCWASVLAARGERDRALKLLWMLHRSSGGAMLLKQTIAARILQLDPSQGNRLLEDLHGQLADLGISKTAPDVQDALVEYYSLVAVARARSATGDPDEMLELCQKMGRKNMASLTAEVLFRGGKVDKALELQRRPAFLLSLGCYDELIASRDSEAVELLGPVLGWLAHGRPDRAWQVIASWSSEITWLQLCRLFLTEQISRDRFAACLALFRKFDTWDPRVWDALRHELQGRLSDARGIYEALEGSSDRLILKFARDALQRLQ